MMPNLISLFCQTISKPSDYVPKQEFKIKPSTLGGPCLRQIYYESAGVPPDYGFPLDGLKRMKGGDAYHDMFKDVMRDAGVVVDYHNPDGSINKDWRSGKPDLEFPLKAPDIYLKKGKIDLVLIVNGELWLAEIKSINTNGFKKLTIPKSDHLTQGVSYFYVFNRSLKEGAFNHIEKLKGFTEAKGVVFVYIHKNDTEMKQFEVTNTDQIFVKIVEKIMKVKHHYDNKILPDRTENFCDTCSWRDKCAKNFNI